MSWVLYQDNIRKAVKDRRVTAMNAAAKPWWLRGHIEVVNPATGETWARRRGSWFKTAPAQRAPLAPRGRPAPAAPDVKSGAALPGPSRRAAPSGERS